MKKIAINAKSICHIQGGQYHRMKFAKDIQANVKYE